MFELVKRYESGSRTQAEFCAYYRLAKGTFSYWLRKYRADRSEAGGFIAVKVSSPVLDGESSPSTLMLTYPDGSRLGFDSSVPVAYIRELIPGLACDE